MLVSIIVPIYNSSKFLEKLLNNVINQTYKNIEIILIDDGSKDNSLQICKKFELMDKRIKLISKTNGGVSSARNKGLELAEGDYVTFIDSDDSIDKNYVATLVYNIEKNVLIKTNMKNRGKEKKIAREKYIKDIVAGRVLGVCWGYLFERTLLQNIRFDINTSYMEDTIFVTQYLLKVSKVKVLKENLYYHKFNEESLTNSNKLENKINEYMYSLDKIEEILINDNISKSKYKNSLENRRIKLIEAEIAKVKNEKEIQTIIVNKNVKEILNIKKVKLKYKLFIRILRTQDSTKIFKYVKIRNKIKRIVKGR